MSGNRSGCLMVSIPKSMSRSGQKKCPGEGSSTWRIFPTGASLNQGKSWYERKNSSPLLNKQIPWEEIFVTSSSEVVLPCVGELKVVFLYQLFNFLKMWAWKWIIVGQLNFRFKLKFCLSISAMNVNVHSFFFTRKEEKAKCFNLESCWTYCMTVACFSRYFADQKEVSFNFLLSLNCHTNGSD